MTFTPIEEYIQLPREIRREHLRLTEPCILIGGNSGLFKGLLAHHLGTTIGMGKKIYLCHACNVPGCSNPRHLYWGTPKDNTLDQMDAGTFKPISERLTKNQRSELGRRNAQRLNEIPRKSRKSRKSRMSAERRAEVEKILAAIPRKRGWVNQAAGLLGVSHTQIRRYVRSSVGRTQPSEG